MARRMSEGREEKRKNLLVTAGLVVAALITLNLPVGTQRSTVNVLRGTVLSPFLEMNGAIARARARARDFDILRAQMDSSTALVSAQRTLAEENRQLRGILSLRNRAPSRFVAATVIRLGTFGSESVFLIDAGSERGIRPFNAVVTEMGLLGQIQEVLPDQASAFDWSHRDFRVSAMTADSRAHGLVESSRGQFREQDLLVLRGTPYLSDLTPGTEVLTSGRGGAFRRGILIGWVSEVAETSAGWSKSYYVDPAVQPGAVTHAVVDIGIAVDSIAAPEPDSAAGSSAGGQP